MGISASQLRRGGPVLARQQCLYYLADDQRLLLIERGNRISRGRRHIYVLFPLPLRSRAAGDCVGDDVS